MAHQYRAGTVDEYTEYIELWDIGSSLLHRRASSVFLEGAVGVIFVHDLTNKNSEVNLYSQWLPMLSCERNHGLDSSITSLNDTPMYQPIFDVESTALPSLVVGCKVDLAPGRIASSRTLDSISVDARNPLTPGTSGYLTVTKFFDAVVKKTLAPVIHDRRRKYL
uniref:Protein kinase domain-containing protein n=1 Tax=Steinernema glaseri TaxID=37863 RepID=A0A1I8A9I3_9BILA